MKPTLLLLHGAVGASAQLKPLAEKLSADFDVQLFDFPGHGGKQMPQEDFSIPFFADELSAFINRNELRNITVFGYSMGGYVALYLEKIRPGSFKNIITLGTKFYWDEAVAEKEIKMLNADTIAVKVPAFAVALEKLHAPNDWKAVLQRTAAMLTAMGKQNPLQPADFASVATDTLLLLGGNDIMVTPEETETVLKNLQKGKMAVLPSTPHPIEKADPDLLRFFILGNKS